MIRTTLTAAGFVILFVGTVLVFEAYWGVGVFVASAVALFALIETVSQRVNPYEPAVDGWEDGPQHMVILDEVVDFDRQDWERAQRLIDRWQDEDEAARDDCPGRLTRLWLNRTEST